MQDKLKAYLDNLFSVLPATDEVKEAKEELLDGMLEHYEDCIKDGMDEQEAYDRVVDSLGDVRELFDELNNGEGQKKKADGFNINIDLTGFVNSVTNLASGLMSGFFNNAPLAEQKLVNTINLPVENVQNIEVSYVSEAIFVLPAPGDELIVKEYMNRDDPALLASVSLRGNDVLIKNGSRQGIFGLRSRVEVLLPQSWHGNLTVGTVGGSISVEGQWEFAAFTGRTVSGEVSVEDITAAVIRLSSTSGSVRAKRAVGQLELHSISGSIKVQQAEGSGSFKTTSGGVRVNFEQLSGRVDASSVSGGVRLNLPQDASFEFEGRSVTGSIYTGFDDKLTFQRRNKAHGFVGEEPYYHVRASSTSGGIHVND